jgi:hypothetical protein
LKKAPAEDLVVIYLAKKSGKEDSDVESTFDGERNPSNAGFCVENALEVVEFVRTLE